MEVTSHQISEAQPIHTPRGRDRTRARLLASGRALFAERGLHGVTSHDVAAQAGVAAGTFYNHFQDKAALFREIAGEALSELDARLDVEERQASSFAKNVRRDATALVQFAIDHRDLMRILFSPDTDAAAVQADVLARLAQRIEDARQLARARGEASRLIDPAVLAQAVVGMWARVLAWWAEDPTRASAESVIETLTQIQLTGTRPNA